MLHVCNIITEKPGGPDGDEAIPGSLLPSSKRAWGRGYSTLKDPSIIIIVTSILMHMLVLVTVKPPLPEWNGTRQYVAITWILLITGFYGTNYTA